MRDLTEFEQHLVDEGLAKWYRDRLIPIVKGEGGAPLYSGVTGGAIALSAATAKTILGVKAHANSGVLLKKVSLGFDGVTGTAVPALAELCYSTWATNAPGTNSTSVTAAQLNGRSLTAGFTLGKTWTSEPTVLTAMRELLVPVFMGDYWYDFPLGDEWDSALGEGFALRITAPATVNARATMDISRC